VSAHGFWIYLEPQERELFLAFRLFPWFAYASIRELSAIEVRRDHLHWSALDNDLDVDRIENPTRYPLVSKPKLSSRSKRRRGLTTRSRTA
jgi:hypothetical protein